MSFGTPKRNLDEHLSKPRYLSVRALVAIPVVAVCLFLLFLFAGVGWAMLAITLFFLFSNLSIFIERLAMVSFGPGFYNYHKNSFIRIRNMLAYRVFVGALTIIYLYLTYQLFQSNARLIDYLK